MNPEALESRSSLGISSTAWSEWTLATTPMVKTKGDYGRFL